MTDTVELALLRGAFEQLNKFCASHTECFGCVLADVCQYGLVCYNNMMYFADDAIYHINHHLGFAAKEATDDNLC